VRIREESSRLVYESAAFPGVKQCFADQCQRIRESFGSVLAKAHKRNFSKSSRVKHLSLNFITFSDLCDVVYL
jgi:hypothetical protein